MANTFAGPGDFLITRGSADKANGPARNTAMLRNHVKGEVVSYGWRPGNGILLTLTGNTVSVPGGIALYTDGGYVNGGGNHFIGRSSTTLLSRHGRPVSRLPAGTAAGGGR
jgi:hypothetical protein